MREEELRGLLREADRACADHEPNVPSPRRIRQLARQKTRQRSMTAGVAGLLVVGVIVAFIATPWRGSVVAPPPSFVKEHPDLMPGGSDTRERIALEAQMAIDHRRRLVREGGAVPVDGAEERNQAARLMVMMAARRGEVTGREEARELYSRAIAMFPETASAGQWREALRALERQN